MPFSLIPEVLNPINVHTLTVTKTLLVIDPVMPKARHVQYVVARHGIRVDD